jgi:hypothetical protein
VAGVKDWNAYVAVTQMHGQGTFYDPRLFDQKKYPAGARVNEGNVRPAEDKGTAQARRAAVLPAFTAETQAGCRCVRSRAG